mgnify:FL=1
MKLILTCLTILLFATTRAQLSIGVIVEPAMNIGTVGSQPEALSDSFTRLKKPDFNTSFGIEIKNQIDRYASFSVIPGYYQTNFLIVKEDLQYLDFIHPELRAIRDQSQGAQKNAYLHYRQKYIGLQLLFAKKLQIQGLPNSTFFELGGGLGAHYLVGNDVKIRTEGFAIDQQYIHVISQNTGFNPSNFSINAIGHADLNYQLDPSTFIIGGLKLNIPMVGNANLDPQIRVYMPTLRFGIRFLL